HLGTSHSSTAVFRPYANASPEYRQPEQLPQSKSRVSAGGGCLFLESARSYGNLALHPLLRQRVCSYCALRHWHLRECQPLSRGEPVDKLPAKRDTARWFSLDLHL